MNILVVDSEGPGAGEVAVVRGRGGELAEAAIARPIHAIGRAVLHSLDVLEMA